MQGRIKDTVWHEVGWWVQEEQRLSFYFHLPKSPAPPPLPLPRNAVLPVVTGPLGDHVEPSSSRGNPNLRGKFTPRARARPDPLMAAY